VKFDATNMVCRGVLASLASTYQLEYEATDEESSCDVGRSAERETNTLGAWPRTAGLAVRATVRMLGPEQREPRKLRMRAREGVVSVLKLGLKGTPRSQSSTGA